MGRTGNKAGDVISLRVRFYQSKPGAAPGTVSDPLTPFSLATVEIFNVAIGGISIASLTASEIEPGLFEVIFNAPTSLPPGKFFDEWTWEATSTSGTKVQRYQFEIIESVPIVVEPEELVVPKTAKKPKLTGFGRKGAHLAVGYWGRDIEKRIDSEQTPQKTRVLLQDKLLARGKDVFLWQQVTESTPNSLGCSCVKDTTERADITCSSCYGTKLIPGYIRFAHETLFLSSISTGAILVNTILDKNIKPHRILLADNQINGSITSTRIQFDNPLSRDWDFKADAANILENNLLVFSFSTDGISFSSLDEINNVDKKPTGVGGIYLRASLARSNVSVRSPEFEIMRVRHANKVSPFIKILRPPVKGTPTLVTSGRRRENIGERFWTSPLDFFDKTVPRDTPSALIQENAFYQRVNGINNIDRYVMTKFMYNEETGIFTHQSFDTRRTQEQEVYNVLVF